MARGRGDAPPSPVVDHLVSHVVQGDLLGALDAVQPSALDWLRTARNLVKYSGDGTYKDVESYLKAVKLT